MNGNIKTPEIDICQFKKHLNCKIDMFLQYVLCSCAGKKEDSKAEIPVLPEEPSGPSPYPINDEFGVPMLELSSDSDTVS